VTGVVERNHGRPRNALTIGLVASVLLHLLILALNPVLWLPEPGASGHLPRASVDRDQLIAVREVPAGADVPVDVRERLPATAPAAWPQPGPAVEGAAEGRRPGAAPADPTIADRLRYRPGPVWAPLDSVQETLEQCRARLVAARIEAGIADSSYGVAPPPAVAERPRQSGLGVSIPFGRKRPPPAQVVPAPLPDTLRRYSQRDTMTVQRPVRRYSPFLDPDACLDETTRLILPRLRTDSARP
jgi:hypothetical protein